MNKVDLLLDQIALIAGNPRAWSARFRSVDLADLAKEITALRAENEALRERVKELREYIDPLEYAELKAGLAADNAD